MPVAKLVKAIEKNNEWFRYVIHLDRSSSIPYKSAQVVVISGAKLYFFRIPLVEKQEDEYFERRQESKSRYFSLQ